MTDRDQAFIEIYNDLENYPTLQDVALRLGLAVQTVKNKSVLIRRKLKTQGSESHMISRAGQDIAPMSEDSSRFMASWGPEECIAELRRVAELDTERVVSRNYFRNNSEISESTWNRYFGTFEEFKRQSGIKLSRQQHNLERQIAKHASVDHYRALSDERMDYSGKYDRDTSGKYKTIVAASDLHDKEVDPFWLRVFLDTCKRVQPDVISLTGDIFDLPEFGKYSVDPREWDVVGRIKFVHEEILGPLREACPEAQVDFIEGNHEARLLRMLADATPALRTVLSDLHGMTVGKLLGLDRFEINYIAKSDLAAYTMRDQTKELAKNYKIYWNCLLAHHMPQGRQMGLPGWHGHHHSHHVWQSFSPVYGAYEWHQIAAGHRREASYAEGEKWALGFAIVNVNTQSLATSFDYIPVTDFSVAGGQWYYRDPREFYGDRPLFDSGR